MEHFVFSPKSYAKEYFGLFFTEYDENKAQKRAASLDNLFQQQVSGTAAY